MTVSLCTQLPSSCSYKRTNCCPNIHFEEWGIPSISISARVQNGSNDYGLFVVAFSTPLCSKDNPSQIHYVQHLLRSHLLKSFKELFLLFPLQLERRGALNHEAERDSQCTAFADFQEGRWYSAITALSGSTSSLKCQKKSANRNLQSGLVLALIINICGASRISHFF